MRIAFFCDAYKPTHSGVAVSVSTTAEELRARGHRVVIYAPQYHGFEDTDPDVIRFPAWHWIRAKDFPVAWPVFFMRQLGLKAEAFFKCENFDLVHSHSPFIIGALGADFAERQCLPLVYTFHTLYHHYLHYAPLPYGFARTYTLRKVRVHCARCNHIICPSEPIQKIVHRLSPTVPTSVVPTGIDVARFAAGVREPVRARYGIKDSDLVLLYVGRLGAEKNLGFLLKALAPLLQSAALVHGGQRQNIWLMLVGGGPAMGELRALAEQLGIASQVIFTDFIEPGAIADYFAAGDIFTFASRTETQGVSIAEALAAGLPCVVVGAMGAAHAITNGVEGCVVPPRDAAFRDAVARLIEAQDMRASMAANARRSALDWSRERRVSQLLAIYESLLAAPRP